MRSIGIGAVSLAIVFSMSQITHAQSTPVQGNGDTKKSTKSSGMSGMSMDQVMAHCAETRDAQKQGKPLTPDIQKMLKECDEMDRQMQMPSGTKSR